MRSAEVRRQFIDFFAQKHGHTFVPSSPVVPHDDPTLLFANAGMNQFKPIFLGTEKPPYTRAVNSQKCIRAGGKHNDLDDVGRDTYHHTFFEMLGNWSFGDYFKAEAIEWAWDLLVNQWKFDPERLHATYFRGDATEDLAPDEEARELWLRFLPEERVHPGSKKDNFWEMGDTGPCGPCSEIHYDRTAGKNGARLVNADSPEVIEIWNLVFIQFNRTPAGLSPLPARHVDTGMGFERVCAVLQGKQSNYDTDVFTPIMEAIAGLCGRRYGGKLDDPADVAMRAIADHVRMATFAITDGARPGPNKADSVLRSVIRRGSRHGYTALGLKEPFLHKLVPVVIEQMGEPFPELREKPDQTAQVIRDEEADFLKVIDRGLGLFADAARQARSSGNRFSGEAIFHLHTTYGFPPDMTIQLARDEGLEPDVPEYERLFREFQDQSRGERVTAAAALDFGDLPETDDKQKYDCLNSAGRVVGFVRGDSVFAAGEVREGEEASLLLNRTCFYAEQGGQVGDTGTIRGEKGVFEVLDTRRLGSRVLHRGRVEAGFIRVGDLVEMHVNNRRTPIMANHTATHLLNLALRQVLGEHVEQRGSLVDESRTRFDFAHGKALAAEEIVKVERLMNAMVRENLEVRSQLVPLEQARRMPGVRAMFGEKYPDPVRVVYISPVPLDESDGRTYSVEFCGGTHARRTGEIGLVKIVSEESVSKGVRRITAVTAEEALVYCQKLERDLGQISQALGTPGEEAPARVAALREEVRQLKKKLASGGSSPAASPAQTAARLLEQCEDRNGVKVVVGEVPDATDEALRATVDAIKARAGNFAAMLATADAEKVSFVAAVSQEVIARGLRAGDWVRETAKVAGGGGGGRPNLAQAGGKDPAKLEEALDRARALVGEALG